MVCIIWLWMKRMKFWWHVPHLCLIHLIIGIRSLFMQILKISWNSLSILCNKYSACCLGKFSHLTLNHISHCTTCPLEVIYSDVWGPSPIISNLGFRYYLIIVYDFCQFTRIYFIRNKSDVFSTYINFKEFVEK